MLSQKLKIDRFPKSLRFWAFHMDQGLEMHVHRPLVAASEPIDVPCFTNDVNRAEEMVEKWWKDGSFPPPRSGL